ncbi:MAG: peptidylprolyl isomerase [Marinilabiliales bacterium]|nr:peptidylprolyl isomerase [Marinilabiliales bacterium]
MTVLLSGCHSDRPRVAIETEIGVIEAELYTDQAPVTAANFLRYAETNRYDTLASFYRVVRPDNQPNNPVRIAVIQGGFYSDSIVAIRQYEPIRHETTRETGLLHLDGTLSMARNQPGTASSEFFICVGDQPELNFGGKRNPDGQGFAAFGRVTQGMDLVRKIQQMKDHGQYLEHPVAIRSIHRAR